MKFIADASFNSYIAGSYTGNFDFDPGPAVVAANAGSQSNGFMVRLDASGNYSLGLHFRGDIQDVWTAVTTDASGNMYITGYTNSTTVQAPHVSLNALWGRECYILKYNAAGTLLWSKKIFGQNGQLFTDVAVDGTGNVYALGYFNGDVVNPTNTGNIFLNNGSNYDAMIYKYDGSGNFLWADALDGAVSCYARRIALDVSANIYIVGGFTGVTDFDPSLTTTSNTTSAGLYDFYLVKLDASGNFTGNFQRWGSAGDETSGDVAVASNGDYLVTGSFTNTVDFNTGPGVSNLTSLGSYDAFLAKYSSCVMPLPPTITSPVPSNGNVLMCAGSNIYIYVNYVGGVTHTWYNSSQVNQGNGDNFPTGVINSNTIFYVDAANTCGTSAQTLVNIVTGITTPTITTTTPYNNCDTGTVSLNATANEGTINWDSALTAGTLLGTGGTYVTPSISTTTTYYVSATDSGCTITPLASVVATIKPIPTITTSAGATICGSGTAVLTATPSAGVVNWYSAMTGGVPFFTGTSYTTPNLSTTTTYYVDAYLNGCTTLSRTAVLVTVNPIPTFISQTSATICGSGSAILSASFNSGILNWYTLPSGGSSVNTGNNYTTPSVSVTTTWYVDATLSGCTSARVPVTLTINPLPSVISAIGGLRCGTGTVNISATASAGIINWFTTPSGGSPIGTGNSFTTPSISVSTIYYAEALNNGCTSASRTMCPADVYPYPTITSTVTDSICSSGSVTISATASVGTLEWYTSSTGGSPIAFGNSYTTPTLSTTTTYYVDATNNGCYASARTPVTVNVHTPVSPSITITASTTTTCYGDTTFYSSSVTNAGNSPTYQWFINGLSVPSATSANYFNQYLMDYDTISCVVYSNHWCSAASSATSNEIGMAVGYSNNVVSVNITTSSTTVCSGVNVTFYANAVAQGHNPIYTWYVNSTPAGGNVDTFNTSNLNTGDIVSV